MRSALPFSGTVEICHSLLKTREFKVSKGGLKVDLDTRWVGPDQGPASCETHRKTPFGVTLNQKDWIFDDDYGSCEFNPEGPSSRAWLGVPPDDYYLTIWTNNTNPNCCLTGDIEVSEDAGLKGETCTELPDDALTILHGALDIAGLVPALGAIPDAINAGIYSIEGDWTNAGLSVAAMVPIFGEGVTVTKLGVKVTRQAIKRTGKEALVLGLKAAKTERSVVKLGKIAGTRGLEHSFDRHAYEWFGRAREAIDRGKFMPQWQDLLERAAESKKVFKWKLGDDAVIGHLAYFQGAIGDVTLKHGKHFTVFFYEAGPRAGEIASAFVPDASQVAEMMKLVKLLD